MIPRAYVTHWRRVAPWPTDAQVEQDLVLSRALVELFSDPGIAGSLAFRGGTALHKLHFPRPGRYSEDIDLVQLQSAPIGGTFDAIRRRLDPWLGNARSKQGDGRATLTYRAETTTLPVQPMRLKIEINTREHVAVLGVRALPFTVASPWFSGSTPLSTFAVEELLGTKLRALYQRKKGRDLYDLWLALSTLRVDDDRIVECFRRYLAMSGASVERAEFEANLADKISDRSFGADVAPLLGAPSGYDPAPAAELVRERLISRLPGAPRRPPGSQS